LTLTRALELVKFNVQSGAKYVIIHHEAYHN